MSFPIAFLLLGPTGSGKTPIGTYLETNGLYGKKCLHFDFGAQLRAIAGNKAETSFLSSKDLEVIRQSLLSGRLLENENFHIAINILNQFLKNLNYMSDDLIIFNGLPRHLGQAADIEKAVEIQSVINLNCTAQTVYERITKNTGRDRSSRIDDSLDLIKEKLLTFKTRTLPLLEFYRKKKVKIIEIEVKADTRPEEVCAQVRF